MSLSSLLKAGSGPVWDWFVEHFPDTQRVCTEANRELRGGSAKELCAVPPVPGTDHGLVGTAVGYLLSAHLREDALDRTVATHAAGRLDSRLRRLKLAPSLIERSVVGRVQELQPWQRRLAAEEWSELCRLVCILARFEQYFRVGPTVLPYLAQPLQDHRHDLDALALALANPPTLEDIDALGRATIEDHASIREAGELYVGPTFAQSLALGGADADVIHDGTLIDLKSTAQAGVVQRHEAWQLLGYLFADTDDVYNIRQVGFAALRRRRSLTWPAQEFIEALAGGSSPRVEHWRTKFARLLEPRSGGARRPAD